MLTTSERPRVALLGTGLMGAPMAMALLRAKFSVSVWNRTAAKALPLAQHGAEVCASAEAAVAQADLVLFMLENGAVVTQLSERLAPRFGPNTLVIDMSSTSQAEALTLHALLARHEIACLDAPVSGGVNGARDGTLAIMAGGSQHDFERAQALFAALGRATLVGGPGTGQVAKLCNQLIVGATLTVVAEALLLAQSAGADPAAVRAAMRGGFADSKILDVAGQRMLERDFRPGGQVSTQAKDLDNVALAAAASGLELPLAAHVRARYHSLSAASPGADHCAILLALERANPGQRLGIGPDQLP